MQLKPYLMRQGNMVNNKKTLKYFSTFTGIGGLDFGLEKQGAKCVGYSEIKKSSIEIYQRHYPNHHNFGDITKIVPEGLPDFDLFVGGFPCQAFSVAGVRKGFTERRGQMIFYIYDILMAKKPEYFVLENVKGITTHDRGKTYENVFKLLSAAGYHVRVVLLNSAHYGSAQNRERIVFIGRRSADFEAKAPEKIDDSKRYRDIRSDKYAPTDVLTPKALERFESGESRYFDPIGGYDRIRTLTTGISSSGMRMMVTQADDGVWRKLTPLEGERAQGFPDGWTEGSSNAKRWFALGNAVNCNVSDYLFNNYLKGLWW